MKLEDFKGEFLRAKEVSKFLGISVQTLHGLTEEGVFPHYKLGGKLLFSRTDLERYITTKMKVENVKNGNI